MKKFLFLLFLSFSIFIPKNVDALVVQNDYTNFVYNGNDLKVATFYTVPSGNHKVNVSGALNTASATDGNLFSAHMYFNLNICTDMDLYSINGPSNIDSMYVYEPGQSCNFNVSNYKGKVLNIYFRLLKPHSNFSSYEGYFYLNSRNSHSIELMNYQASPDGFPLNNESYTDDLEELKEILRNGNTGIKNSIDDNTDAVKKQTEATKEQTETIKDNDVSKSQSQAGGFFNDFDDNDFGLSDIITMPLSFIQGLANNSCSNLNLPLPFVDKNATLPCMTSIYEQHFGAFLTIYQIITTGFISYWVCINVFRLVKNFKDPNNDEVEVLDL